MREGLVSIRPLASSCQIATAVKRARELSLLPYVNESAREDGPRGRGRDRDRDRD